MGMLDLFKPNVEEMRKKKDVKGLTKALRHKDIKVRCEAAEALGELRDAKAIESLV